VSTSTEWIAAFCERLGVEAPSEDEVAMILAVASRAAHSSERTAAPIACWLAARQGLSPAAALDLARSIDED
jgi:Domain of unknown function (DUF6457)